MADEHDWSGMSVEFRLDKATVVAMFDNCDAIHETGLTLNIQDGRMPSYFGPNDDDDDDFDEGRLEYHCIINPVGSDPQQVESREARINIDGIHENGKRLTIKGEGWAGRDQDGVIEILFDDPPRMVIYDYLEDEEDDDSASDSPDNVVSLR